MARRPLVGGILLGGLLAVIGLACGSSTTSPSSTTVATSTTTVASPITGPVTLSPASLAFAINAAAGSTQTVTLTNTGSARLTIASIAVSGNFSETDDCGTSVEVGASCTITVTFNPVVVGSGGMLTITDDASTSPQTVTVTGPNVLGPNAILTPSSLTFETQAVGTMSSAQTVTLTNAINGVSTPLSIFGVQITGDDFAIVQNACASSLAAGASCTVSITFTPGGQGSRSGTFAIFDNAPKVLQSIPLSGFGQ